MCRISSKSLDERTHGRGVEDDDRPFRHARIGVGICCGMPGPRREAGAEAGRPDADGDVRPPRSVLVEASMDGRLRKGVR